LKAALLGGRLSIKGEARMNSTPQKEFFAGVKAESPILVGVIPFGMIYGVLALSAGNTGWRSASHVSHYICGFLANTGHATCAPIRTSLVIS